MILFDHYLQFYIKIHNIHKVTSIVVFTIQCAQFNTTLELSLSDGRQEKTEKYIQGKLSLSYGDSGEFEIEVSNCTCNILKILKAL